MYPRLNQGEWLSPLLHSLHKLDSVMGYWSQGQRKMNITYGVFKQKTKLNISESDSEKNEVANSWGRLIVIESLEAVCRAKFSPFLTKKVLRTRITLRHLKKKKNKKSKLACWGGQPEEGRKHSKNENFPQYICPHERCNISKSRELALATAEEKSAASGKQEVTNIRRITIKKGREKIETSTCILPFNQL